MARKNNDRFNQATGSPSAARQGITSAPLKTIGKTAYSCDDAAEHHCRSNYPIGAAWGILRLFKTLGKPWENMQMSNKNNPGVLYGTCLVKRRCIPANPRQEEEEEDFEDFEHFSTAGGTLVKFQ